MSRIENLASNLEPGFNKIRDIEQNILIRHCGNCEKEFLLTNVIKLYPELYQDSIIKAWQKTEVTFYCTYCYFLKLVKLIKKNKNNH
ncbi:hypothetical protein LCGC14_1554870 [marine sediment metagenome]|uniref:Uncharacterized protein n=1 Tax=marine sediment metagenome TaxID=412755 RepID=A0A0F9LQ06_9ZZZZ